MDYFNKYHAGEREVQRRAGTEADAAGLAGMINNSLNPAVVPFIRSQEMILCSSIDEHGKVWASSLFGPPGFITPLSETQIEIRALPSRDDPLAKNLKIGSPIGFLLISLSTRKRFRINGVVSQVTSNSFRFKLKEAFGNCPKYIQQRVIRSSDVPTTDSQIIEHKTSSKTSDRLTPDQEEWITSSDTLFLGTAKSQSEGADVSHKGGLPNFVRVISSNRIEFPDYYGNNMFQSLGNITLRPQVGLLFLDFENGKALQLSGKAEILWDKHLDESGRSLGVDIDSVVEIEAYMPLRFDFQSYSHHNPSVVLEGEHSQNILVKCVRIKKETHDVTSFFFENVELNETFSPFIPGQYATFLFDWKGQKLERTWTISSAPTRVDSRIHQFSISVKRKENGLISNFIHDNLKVGEILDFKGFGGEFSCLQEKPKKMLMIAGGIGVTPMISMIRYLFSVNQESDCNAEKCEPYLPEVTLLYSAQTAEDIAFLDELLAFQSMFPKRFVLHLLLTRNKIGVNSVLNSAKVTQGRITKQILGEISDLKDRTVYLCGPEPFMSSVTEQFSQLNFSMDRLLKENYDF